MTATPSDPSLRSMTALRIAMIRRRRMPTPARRKPSPARTAGRPGQRPAASPARPAPAPGLVADQRAGATLVRWRSLLGREDAPPITGRRVGWATLTTLYTLAIYGALVLLVVYWSTQFGAHRRVGRQPRAVAATAPAAAARPGTGTCRQRPGRTPPRVGREPAPPASAATPSTPTVDAPARAPHADTPETETPATVTPQPAPAPAPPHSPDHRNPRRTARQLAGRIESRAATLRRLELLRPAGLRLGRTQAILRTQGWGTVKECPARP